MTTAPAASRPLAVTMGDPSGIGPEVVAKALAARTAGRCCVVLGDAVVLRHAIELTGLSPELRVIPSVEQASLRPGVIELVETSSLAELPANGEVTATSGQAAFDAIREAILLARDSRVSGIVTAPIHKAALAAAGIDYPGHTEILAEYGGARRVAMMLANDELRIVLVTIHCSLREAIERADLPAQMSAIRRAHEGVRALGIEAPRIAVAGLNPHAGEGGLFGDEELRIIAPAIEQAQEQGMDVTGPWPGDTVFMMARAGRFDVVVAQYHDQGLIPIKYLGLDRGVNITLGLPFVRTSPDHGTAFDIAGRGVADPSSMNAALQYAARLVAARTQGGA